MQQRKEHLEGRLTGPVGQRGGSPAGPGLSSLEGSDGRQHLLYVPSGGDEGSVPLVVLFHGAGSDPVRMLRLVEREAESAGAAVVLPKSHAYTWDAVLGAFGPDVAELDRLLDTAFRLVPVDPDRLAVGGFSDGASYALSVGLVNGDRFRRILAFSPGFVVPGRPAGKPSIFVSHGVSDAVLPIERCSRLLVPALRREGYVVDYREFDGGHIVPSDLAADALRSASRPAR